MFTLKETFTLADGFGDYTLEQYADLVIQANNLGSAEIKNVDEYAHQITDWAKSVEFSN